MYRLRGESSLELLVRAKVAQNKKFNISPWTLFFFFFKCEFIPLGFPVDSKPKSRAYSRMFVSYDALKIHDALKI